MAYLQDWAAEGDVEELLHRGAQGGTPRHHKPDPPTKCLLDCLQNGPVNQGAHLQHVMAHLRRMLCMQKENTHHLAVICVICQLHC